MITQLSYLLENFKKNKFTIFLIILGIFILYTAPRDPDLGWHYKYGEHFWTYGKILRENIFSFTNVNYQWVNSYWIFEIVIFALYHTIGNVFATLLITILISIVLVKITNSLGKNKRVGFLWFMVITSILSEYSITVRPHMFSTVFLFLLMIVLLYKETYIKYLPILFLIWANTHAEFTIGLFIFGIYSVNNLIRKNIKPTIYLIISSVITLINPYGIHLWTTLFKELSLPVKNNVMEWNSLPSEVINNYLGIILIALLSGLSGTFKKIWWYPLTILFFFLFSFKATYMFRVLIIVASFGIYQTFEKGYLFITRNKHIIEIITKTEKYLLIIISILMATHFYENIEAATNIQKWSKINKYPYEAVNYLKNHNIEGNIFNNYNWGGYLIWQLPKHKTFIDGRMTSWREGNTYFMDKYYEMVKEPQKYKENFTQYQNEYNIKYVLISKKEPLNEYLQNKGWKVLFEDNISIILQDI